MSILAFSKDVFEYDKHKMIDKETNSNKCPSPYLATVVMLILSLAYQNFRDSSQSHRWAKKMLKWTALGGKQGLT